MKQIFFALQLLMVAVSCFGQSKVDKITLPIVAEGKRLYHSEMASWYGTDIFLQQYKNQENIGGYFSYPTGAGAVCIFFSKTNIPKVIGAVSFDSTYSVSLARLDLTERRFTDEELSLFMLRTSALLTVAQQDTVFRRYSNTANNVVPLISNSERKAYVFTAPKQSGTVIFGNDYLLTFDVSNKVSSIKKLHQNIISVEYGKKGEEGSIALETMHTHSAATGDFITATDICTLMLYEKNTGWKQHSVISANYLSIWDCQTNQLVILTKKALDRIDKSHKKFHSDK